MKIMEKAKAVVIFFIIVSILIFAFTHGVVWLKDSGMYSLSALVAVFKFDIPVPR